VTGIPNNPTGTLDLVDPDRIVGAVARCCDGLEEVEPMRVATQTIGGLYDGATTSELDQLSIQTAAGLMAEEPQYSRWPSGCWRPHHQCGAEAHRFARGNDSGADDA
jgi:ribonucleoside-diphosphate reductase alpha chain